MKNLYYLKTIVLSISLLFSMNSYSQTTVNLASQCNCEVMTSATEVSTGATTPAATEVGTLLVDPSGDIFYWDGDSWEQATVQNQGPWFSMATNTPASSNTDNVYMMGDVGIGTDSPSTDLDVDGGVRFRSLADGSAKDSIVTIGADGNLSKLSVGDLFTNSVIEEPMTDVLYAGFSHENQSISISSTINGLASLYTNLVNATDDGGGALTFNTGTNSVYSQHANATEAIDATGEELIATTTNSFAQYSTVSLGLSTDPNSLGSDTPYKFIIAHGNGSGTNSVYINGELKYNGNGYVGTFKITRTENGLNFSVNDVLVYCHINGSTTGENITSKSPWFNTETNDAATENTDSVYIMGKVGVGIDSPEAMLHINGSNEELLRLGDGVLDNKWLTFRNDWGGVEFGLKDEVLQGSTPPYTSLANGYALIKAGAQKGFAISTDNATGFNDVDSTNLDLVISRAGEVGIGTFDPKELLDVEGNAHADNINLTDTKLSTVVDSASQSYFAGLEHNIDTAYTSIISGDSLVVNKTTNSMILGRKDTISSELMNSIIVGKENNIEVKLSNSVIAGNNNKIDTRDIGRIIVQGENHVIQQSNQIVGGHENLVKSWGNFVFGARDTIDANSTYNIVGGIDNYTTQSDYNLHAGRNNRMIRFSHSNLLVGNNNSIDRSENGLIGGKNNKIAIDADNSFVIGQNSTVNSADENSVAMGDSAYTSAANQFVGEFAGDILLNSRGGKVGIGTYSPSSKLDVNGNLRVRDLALGTAADSIVVADANGVLKKIAPGAGGLWEAGTIVSDSLNTVSQAVYAMNTLSNGDTIAFLDDGRYMHKGSGVDNITHRAQGAIIKRHFSNESFSTGSSDQAEIYQSNSYLVKEATGETATRYYGTSINMEVADSRTSNLTNVQGDNTTLLNNGSGDIINMSGTTAIATHNGTGTVSTLTAFEGRVTAEGPTTKLRAILAQNKGDGAITNSNVIDITSSINNAITERGINIASINGGSTENYGIYIDNVFDAADNYALYTNLGKVRLGDTLLVSNGPVGIGTDTPSATLHVDGSNEEIMRLGNGGLDNKWLTFRDPALGTQFGLKDEHIGGASGTTAAGYSLIKAGTGKGFGIATNISDDFDLVDSTDLNFLISRTGDVGIGTYDPRALFHVEGKSYFSDTITTDYSLNFGGSVSAGGFIQHGWDLSGDGNGDELKLQPHVNPSAFSKITFYTNRYGTVAERMRISDTGNVGIGTNNPSEKLEVTGNIKASGNLQSGTTTYPDYVFEAYEEGSSDLNKSYAFKSLEEVENFIKINKHLPGVTGIDEIEKTAEGYSVNMTVLSIQTLEKVEELFLYTIEQNKRINKLEAENAAMKKRLDAIESMLSEKK